MVPEVLEAGLKIFCAVEEYDGSNQCTGRVEIVVVVGVQRQYILETPKARSRDHVKGPADR